MADLLSRLRPPRGARASSKKRPGRGIGSGLGKTCGRGEKGDKARGASTRPGFEGGQMPLFRRIARRGFSNMPFKKEFQVVNVSDLNRFADGDAVTPATLAAKGLARKRGVPVKILGQGELAKRLVVEGVTVSSSAREKIAKLGGEVRGGKTPAAGAGAAPSGSAAAEGK